MSKVAAIRAEGTRPPAAKRTRAAAGARPRERNCSVARTVAILSDAWTFLVIREAFFGARRFETFRVRLGLPRGTLAERLKKLTRQGILRQVRQSETSSRHEYRLTRVGLDLYASFIALLSFGDRWLADGAGPPLTLIHKDCGGEGHALECHPFVACSACGGAVEATRVTYRDGPGAGSAPLEPLKRSRRASDPSQFERGRPCSVARTLQIIGDRWSFLVIRQAFFGARRFDELQARLNIASNILADRLARLVAEGILERRKYQDLPERFEYRFSAKGKDLYGSMIMMMVWGDRWLSGGEPPLVLTHRDCGRDFTPVMVCDRCHEPIEPRAMAYRMNYPAEAALALK
ncbi:transcriptional regulator, HxlR family [Tistlia consotensis]|uniref:Transcriptional regulator, HxlR family n=1 Tax=Tistlia consotensis USBA 355 TaxID=560819 RepID=A0A1Y6CEA0_9PROT|nr:helix-turn-helix domain-containing protein [Tistlia consotensis]SMF58678.1 transcriptional regulator, HxlR family [Tistlia consotensis USBA 355]SNR63603.1 transcriptional regulator, HxlR family [Tistlia consotensis]